MNAPQLIYICITVLGLGVILEKNGKPRTDKYSFGWALTSTLVSFGLLYWGGFFSGGAA